MEIKFSDISSAKSNVAVIGVFENCQLTPLGKELDAKTGGKILKACELRKFKGKKGQFLLYLFPENLGFDALILTGLGVPKELKEHALQCIGGSLIPYINRHNLESAAFLLDKEWTGCKLSAAEVAANLAFGATLRSYAFNKYKTKQKPEDLPTLKQFSISLGDHAKAASEFKNLQKLADAVDFARDIVSEPANVIYPESLAELCKGLSSDGIKVDVLGEDKLKKLGMNSLLGVGQGSARESRVVTLEWNGAGSSKKGVDLALVGKGVTFDSGGISIKPSGGMEEMKWDMAGSAAVIATIKALAARKAKVNVVGVIGLVENMPSGTAQRPGDVVKSMSGQTIEVINTDAEGRLVLADVLWYAQEKFKPATMIDLATLTGAIVVAVGSFKAGLFSNSEKLAKKLTECGEMVGEKLWEMPLGDEYDKQINSAIADMQNVGEGREAGSTAGAVFLQRFVQDGVKWAHLDIAGVAWSKKDSDLLPKGATAFGVRLLDRLCAEHFEG